MGPDCALPWEARLSLRADRSRSSYARIRRSATDDSDRARRTRSIEPRSIDSSSTPRPTRASAPSTVPASSPQTATDTPPRRDRRRDDRADRPHDCRAERVAIRLQGRVRPVGGEEVLGKVVGADTHERDPPSQLGSEQDGRRDLDHDPGDEPLGGVPGRARQRSARPRIGAHRTGRRPRPWRPSGPSRGGSWRCRLPPWRSPGAGRSAGPAGCGRGGSRGPPGTGSLQRQGRGTGSPCRPRYRPAG